MAKKDDLLFTGDLGGSIRVWRMGGAWQCCKIPVSSNRQNHSSFMTFSPYIYSQALTDNVIIT